jgi:hypothetical protein
MSYLVWIVHALTLLFKEQTGNITSIVSRETSICNGSNRKNKYHVNWATPSIKDYSVSRRSEKCDVLFLSPVFIYPHKFVVIVANRRALAGRTHKTHTENTRIQFYSDSSSNSAPLDTYHKDTHGAELSFCLFPKTNRTFDGDFSKDWRRVLHIPDTVVTDRRLMRPLTSWTEPKRAP